MLSQLKDVLKSKWYLFLEQIGFRLLILVGYQIQLQQVLIGGKLELKVDFYLLQL